jgi:hypothetical protein
MLLVILIALLTKQLPFYMPVCVEPDEMQKRLLSQEDPIKSKLLNDAHKHDKFN